MSVIGRLSPYRRHCRRGRSGGGSASGEPRLGEAQPCSYLVNRPNKSLHPFELVIHDCWLAARRRASVRPIVRRALGLESESGSLILASVCSFLSAAAAASAPGRGPNSLSLKVFFMALFEGVRAVGAPRASPLDAPSRNVSTLCSNSDSAGNQLYITVDPHAAISSTC